MPRKETPPGPELLKQIFPHASRTFLAANAPLPSGRKVSHPEPQRYQAPTLGPTVQGKAPGDGRVTVRFTGYRVRPLDPDNFAGSVKDLLDGLRHAGILLGDEPHRIRLETEQERVGSYEQERTEIIVIQP